MVNLTIDGIKVSVPIGSTILQAAKEVGIKIPTLCYHPDQAVKANCRVCVCEVEGNRLLQTACSTPAFEGMAVKTRTPKVIEARKTILELILANHPQDCLNCMRNQNCELQTLAEEYSLEYGNATVEMHTDAVKPGDRVALEPGYPCRRCSECLAGRYNLCPDMSFAATPPIDGTLTGMWSAPADFCYKLPDGVSLQEGALLEPLAVAVHIVRQARVQPGQSVVVMGAGPVGLLCAAVAKAYGASKVVSVDIVQSKLDFAKGFASTHTYASQRIPAEDNAKAIRDLAGLPRGADAVIDASGAEPSIQTSLHTVKMGGTYVQGGMGKADINFPIMALCLKEVTARGSFRYGPGDYHLAVDLVATGKVDVKKLVTGVVPFDKAEEAFKKVKEGEAIKILIAGPNEKL